MVRLLGAVLLAVIVIMGSAFAQSPMSPIYPTGPAKPQPTRPAVKEIAPASDHEANKATPSAEASPTDEPPVATAVIPPVAEPNKPAAAEAKSELTPEPHQVVKQRKRTARRARYARRLYMPYPARWYFETNAGTRGWGGGQFGPSPYSSNGQ